MSDLKTRIGPKVGQEHFPNKSWVRPGFESKSTKQRTQWHHRRQSEGYGSDVSEHESDSPRRTPKSNRTASLLTRMGLESPDGVQEQTDGISVNDSVSPIEETQRTQHKASYASESIRSQAQGLHVDPKTGFTNKGADLLNQPATTENKKTFLDSNNHSVASQSSVNASAIESRDATQYGHVAQHSIERISDKDPSLRPSANGPPNPLPISTIPNHLQSNAPSTSSISFQKTSSQQTVSEEGELSNHDMRPQDAPSLEEGEVRSESLPADKVRDLVLPLVLRIAANRVSDAERATVPSQSLPPPVNTVALTDEFLKSFAAKGTTEVRKEMRAREGESASSAWRPQQATSISRRDSSDVLMATPMAGPAPMAPGKETGTLPLRPTTNIRDAAYAPTYDRHGGHGPPLRRHPSPKAQDFARTPPMNHVSEPSSSKLPETRFEPRAKRLRSRSPPTGPPERYLRRRRSSSRDDGPNTYERPIIHPSEYGPRSAHGRAYSQSKYDRPYHVPGLPHTPPSASRPQYAERMTARSPSPMTRSGGRRVTRSPIRGREVHSPPTPASAPMYAPRPREQGHQRGYSAHYGSSEYRDTRYRKPYEPRSSERRRSRTPPRRPSIPDQHIPPSLRRRSRERMDVDYNYRSKSRSTEGRRGYVSPSPQRPQKQESRQRIPIPESPKVEDTQPPANIRLWSAQRGLDRLGILKWTFEVDQQTATRLGLDIRMENPASSADTPVLKPTKKTSLHLACYPRDSVVTLLEKANTGQSPSPETSSINHAWPTFGHLIIKVNEELPGFQGKTWLPDKLGPNSPAIVLDHFVRPGQNVIELVQLSGMDDKVFWLSEQDNPDTPNELSVDSHEFASSANSMTLSELIPIKPASVTITEMIDLT
ncbi:hypothetical protein BJ912DRAFT_136680 [Pholiota molesta]|nr:hypothetical protein BJ912DRAFT_136680 [Pholiota molesta]